MEDSIIVLVGFSASGKDSIASYLKDNYNYNFIVSVTNRPMRPNESQGNPYNFVTFNDFIQLIDTDKLIEYRTYDTVHGTWFYGVKKDAVLPNNKYVVVLDLWGLSEFKKYFGGRVKSFFIQVDNETRENRAKSRGGFDLAEWNRRLEDDKRIFEEEDITTKVDCIIPNYDFGECILSILNNLNHIHVEELEG